MPTQCQTALAANSTRRGASRAAEEARTRRLCPSAQHAACRPGGHVVNMLSSWSGETRPQTALSYWSVDLMTSARAIAPAEAATSLILEVFRLNGQLLAAADRLVSGLDLTSARWQVLGAIANSDSAKPVAWLARDLSMHRQG